MARAAIRSLGVYLPENVRTNDFWSADLVASWMEGRRQLEGGAPPSFETEGMTRVAAAMAEAARDPFNGARRRHIMADDQEPSDLEAAAATDALERAGLTPDDIDFLMVYSSLPDRVLHPNAAYVHEKLGLPKQCFTLSNDGACNGFHLQLHLADQLIATGRHRRGLLVQSSSVSRLLPPERPYAAWFGDGATAVVVEASDTHGVIADAHHTDSSLAGALVAGVPGQRWTDGGGPVEMYLEDKGRSLRMLLTVADSGDEVLQASLDQAGMTRDQVDFYAGHQANVWFRAVTQQVMGLEHARAVDSFPWAGSMGACNLPLVMATAEREGKLHPGDVVAMYSGGSGITYAGTLLRFGT